MVTPRKKYSLTVVAGFMFIALLGCNHKKAAAVDPLANDPYKRALKEKKIEHSNYYISLPANYVIKEDNGPDFDVYYFYPLNKADSTSYKGGLYFGNAPAAFHLDTAVCKNDSLQSSILGETESWSVYNCNEKYFVQIITASKSGTNWNMRIHAFGHASSKTDLHKLMVVFATLHK